MLVHFYEIRGCTCANVDNHPVLVAPANMQLDRLTYYHFVLLEDGRWVHFLTPEEYAHVMKGYPAHDVVFHQPGTPLPLQQSTPEDTAKGNLLALIGLGLNLAGIVLIVLLTLFSAALDTETEPSLYECLMVLPCLAQIAAFILMIVTRIRYPDNTFGKVLMWVLIVEVILAVLAIIALIVFCAVACNYCVSEMKRCPG